MSYTIRYERAGGGFWLATVKEIDGCLTQGRSIDQARKRIREALSLFVKDWKSAELIDEVKVDGATRRAIRRLRSLQAIAARTQADAAATARELARALVRDEGMSVRDAGEVLGISFQRVAQLVEGGK
jgi:predicted RNase H-like HicB family nuclease